MARAEVSAAPRLSEREHQIAELYVAGRSYKEIARALGIAPATVRTHINAVYRKLEVTSRIELLHRLGRRRQSASAAPMPANGLAEAAAAPWLRREHIEGCWRSSPPTWSATRG